MLQILSILPMIQFDNSTRAFPPYPSTPLVLTLVMRAMVFWCAGGIPGCSAPVRIAERGEGRRVEATDGRAGTPVPLQIWPKYWQKYHRPSPDVTNVVPRLSLLRNYAQAGTYVPSDPRSRWIPHLVLPCHPQRSSCTLRSADGVHHPLALCSGWPSMRPSEWHLRSRRLSHSGH
ncbi:hypothetical protein C8F01DRAFT_387339 [Mycena amicta]|nr:hypothetical protein C8F01DRAFT_387339 [Mycena amicta]